MGLYVAYHTLQWMLKRWGSRWGVRGQEDWAALGVLLLILNVLEFVSMPIGNGFSRMQEHAADVYGLEVVHGLVPIRRRRERARSSARRSRYGGSKAFAIYHILAVQPPAAGGEAGVCVHV